MDDGFYAVKNGEVYKVDLPVGMKPTKTVNIRTGEVYYLTNCDRIKHMSAEELAVFFAKKIAFCYGCESPKMDTCVGCWHEWLKQEVTE